MTRQFAAFALAGAVGFVVDSAVLYTLLWSGLGYFAGRIASFLCAVFTTWQINRRLAFREGRQRATWREWWHYLAAMSLGGVVNYATFAAVVLIAPATSFTPLLAVAAGSLVAMVFNFASARNWVFRSP